ncbi:MAG: hypothetical protein JOZ81_18675, partial [Chloroflexi bacterium]|nr:hypothetical protein [Chloroflexota bacterium]
IYDLEVDTSRLSPAECANAIRQRQLNGLPPSAFHRLASLRRVTSVVAYDRLNEQWVAALRRLSPRR